jgi:hypothetical protein
MEILRSFLVVIVFMAGEQGGRSSRPAPDSFGSCVIFGDSVDYWRIESLGMSIARE